MGNQLSLGTEKIWQKYFQRKFPLSVYYNLETDSFRLNKAYLSEEIESLTPAQLSRPIIIDEVKNP